MDCYTCRECLTIVDKPFMCTKCGSRNTFYDRYGRVRRLIVNCLDALTDEEVARIANTIGCDNIGHSEMYTIIGKLIN